MIHREGPPRSTALELAAALGVTPLLIGVGALAAPRVDLGEALASAVVYGGATTCALLALALACRRPTPWRRQAAVAAVAAVMVLVVALTRSSSPLAGALLDGALVALGWAVGSAIGQRVEHPGHLFPACVVVACADLVSTVSSSGPTHAIASSERLLPLVAVSFPVPGTTAFAPVLGVGDLVFIALVLATASAHRLPYGRAVALCAVGLAVAGMASALLGTAVPALVPIGLAVVLGIPAVRTLRPRDRRAAHLAMFVAVCLAGATLGSRLFVRDGAHPRHAAKCLRSLGADQSVPRCSGGLALHTTKAPTVTFGQWTRGNGHATGS